MKTNSKMFALVSALTLVTTAAGVAHAQDTSTPRRGTIEVQGQASKAVVTGPVAIHAYSAFSGATLFVVAAVTGTDRDCAGARTSAVERIGADHVRTFTVGAGQVACVATTAAHGSELLWHVDSTPHIPVSPVFVVVSR
jgi:hypothetical protein